MPSGPAFQVGNGFVQGGLGPDYPMLIAYRLGSSILKSHDPWIDAVGMKACLVARTGAAVALNAPAR